MPGRNHQISNDRFLLTVRDNDNTSQETNRLLRRSGVPLRDGRVIPLRMVGFQTLRHQVPQLPIENQNRDTNDILQDVLDMDMTI